MKFSCCILLFYFFYSGCFAQATYTGQGLSFEGAQRATTQFNSNGSLDLDDFTIEAIIQIDISTTTVSPTIVSNRTTGKFGIRFAILDGNVFSTGKLYVRIGSEAPVVDVSGIAVNDGYCHHVAVRRQGSTIQFIVDGVMSGSYTTATPYDASSSRGYWIGDDFLAPDESYFYGYIRNIRIWRRFLDDQELNTNRFAELNGTENALVACWNLNEEGQQTFTDISPNQQHGILGKTTDEETIDPKWSLVKCGKAAVRNSDEIKSLSTETIRINPNPSTNQFSVISESLNSENTSISITSPNGISLQHIEHYRGESIPINFPAGIYRITATDGVKQYSTNLAVQ